MGIDPYYVVDSGGIVVNDIFRKLQWSMKNRSTCCPGEIAGHRSLGVDAYADGFIC